MNILKFNSPPARFTLSGKGNSFCSTFGGFMAVQVYSLGAAQEVTGSKHILEVDGKIFMIDCGAFQGKRSVANEKNKNIGISGDKINTVILTHAHYDHCGLLPVIAKDGFGGNIYATPATRDLADLVMMDSAKIQYRDAEFLRKQAQKKGEKFSWTPLFLEKDCVKAENQIVSLSYNRKMFIAPNVELEFFDAGHILGSAFASITVHTQRGGKFFRRMTSFWNTVFSRNKKNPENVTSKKRNSEKNEIRILYTGDLGRPQKPIIRDPSTDIPAPDYIFLESTYGNRLHEGTQIAMDELRKIIRNAVNRKGKIIIPSFAIERTQELVYYIHLLVDQRKIPKIPVYVDSPMAVNATSIFRIHPECYDEEVNEAFIQHHKNPFGFSDLTLITSVEESKALNEKEGPMIIISADGMCEAGRIQHHLANGISNPKNTLLIVGYMAENTLGRRIRDGAKEVRIMDKMYPVKAEIKTINAFSAHADYKEALSWLNSIDTSRLKKIFLVHGEKDAQEFFKDYLEKNGYKNVQIVKYGETYKLV